MNFIKERKTACFPEKENTLSTKRRMKVYHSRKLFGVYIYKWRFLRE